MAKCNALADFMAGNDPSFASSVFHRILLLYVVEVGMIKTLPLLLIPLLLLFHVFLRNQLEYNYKVIHELLSQNTV